MQGDVFGEPAPAAYVVPHEIAVNTLRKTWEKMASASAWPWDADMKTARMKRSVPKMLAVLTPEEAADCRARIDVEASRLDAAA